MPKKYIVSLLAILPVFVAATAKAFCPICTAVVISGVGLSRWLKIDDTITGLWIGGLLVSTSGWTINWCNKKKLNFWGRDILIPIAYYMIAVIPLYMYEIVGHPFNKFWGVDKLILGIVTGSIFFYAAHLQYQNYKAQHGKALFPFQRIVIPVGTLAILSLVFYLVTRQNG